MIPGTEFLGTLLKAMGGLTVLLGIGGMLFGSNDSPSGWLADWWRCIARLSVLQTIPAGVRLGLAGFDRGIRYGFENVDRNPAFGIVFIGLVFVMIPVAAGVNALIGGSPLLLQGYLGIMALFAALLFSGQGRRQAGLWSAISGALALTVGLVLLLGVPVYVLISFTDRISHETISHAFLLSLLIAPFYYVAAFSSMAFLESVFIKKGPSARRTPTLVFVRRFLAAVPVAFVLVFLVLMAAQVAVNMSAPVRTPQMLIAAIGFTALSLPMTLSILSRGASKGGVFLLGGFLNGFVSAAACSAALLYFSVLSTPDEMTMAEIANVLIGKSADGAGVYLGHDFWVMHLPMLPIIGLTCVAIGAFMAKILSSLWPWLTRGRTADATPFLAAGLVIVAAGVGMFAMGTLLGPPAKVVPGPAYSHYRWAPSPIRLVQVLSGHSRTERRERVRQTLGFLAADYSEQPFRVGTFDGVNLIADVGGDKNSPMLIYFTHYDPIPGTPAANDNASCIAAAVAALDRLKKSPPKNLRVRFIFSDGEEYGLLGAKAYGEAFGYKNVAGVVSFEMCGIGDAIGIWDVTGPAVDSGLVRALQQAAEGLGVHNGTHGAVPRFGSDHRAFDGSGLAAVGVTLLPEDDEDTLRSYVDNPNNPIWALTFMRPVIFRTYHTLEDVAETIDPVSMDLAARLMVDTANILDH